MARELFQGSEAAEWRGEYFARLARLCQAGELTEMEAQVVNGVSRGLPFPEIGRMMGKQKEDGETKQEARERIRKSVQETLRRAEGKLSRYVFSLPRPKSEYRPAYSTKQALWEILGLMRSFQSKPPTPTYDKRGTLVTARGRLVLPEDLTREPPPAPSWMTDICTLLWTRLDDAHQQDVRAGGVST